MGIRGNFEVSVVKHEKKSNCKVKEERKKRQMTFTVKTLVSRQLLFTYEQQSFKSPVVKKNIKH